MEGFDGTPEEKKAVSDLLTEMGYTVEGGGHCCQPSGEVFQVQKDVKELGLDAFMEAIPKGTGVRTMANLSRFLKTLAEEPDFAPVDLTDVVAAPAQPKENPGFLSWPAKDSAKDDASAERFYVTLHNIVRADEEDRKLTIRVIHLARFVEFSLGSRRHARLVLPQGSSLQLMCEMTEGVRFHRAVSAKDLGKGAMVLAHSWHQGRDRGFAALVKPPLAPQPTSSVYHFCGPDPGTERDVLKVWHMRPGEVNSEANLTKLKRYQSMTVLPEFDATADLAELADADGVLPVGRSKVRIHLHNVSAEKEKFRVKLKVTLPDDAVATFQLDSHCHSALRLPKGSSIEATSQSEDFPKSKASITLGPKDLKGLVNGANVGHPSRGKACRDACGRSSILWHFCTLGMETLFIQPKAPSKHEKQQPGVAITSGESYAVTASDSVLTVWDNQPNLLAEKSKLREKVVELDTCKFVDRHVYVIWDSKKSSENFTDGFIGAWAGTSSLSDSSEWDALQTDAFDMDLEAGHAPSNNMPTV
eukprot:Skav224575  [mRNA]  locus=scaffold246:103255:105631:- [translate_table: standard]